jgi:hypothetical protein
MAENCWTFTKDRAPPNDSTVGGPPKRPAEDTDKSPEQFAMLNLVRDSPSLTFIGQKYPSAHTHDVDDTQEKNKNFCLGRNF